jgi:predicted transposase YbfD/YdcC
VVRAHWGVENSLHWVLDVTMILLAKSKRRKLVE